MSKTKEDIVGTRIGIYDILYECDFKSKCNHKMYHVRCSECGWESNMSKNDIRRAKKCTHIGKLTEEKINEWYNLNKKKCLHCGEFIPFNNLGFNEYKERQFCNVSCSVSYTNKITKRKHRHKFCKNCGTEIIPQNTYCSLKCQNEYNFNDYIQKWKSKEVNGMCGKYSISKHIRKYLMKKYNNKCSKCGWGEINPFTGTSPLEVHHKDGDYTNNDEENLDLLCPNCHALTSNYKAANKGNGRKSRNKYNT